MTRRFVDRPIPKIALRRILDAASHAPSAGATPGVELRVFEEADDRARFWELASDPAWRASSRPSTSVLRAPVVVLPLADPAAYVARYARQDKATSSLQGLSAEDWPVPYWIVDASFAVMLMLLACEEARLGALFFRLHASQRHVLDALGVAPGIVTIGAVALGYADEEQAGKPRSKDALAPPVHGR